MSAKIFHYFLVFIAALGLNLSVDASDSFLQKDIATFSSKDNFSKLHLPFKSAPTPIDREIPNENEQEEDFDNDSDSFAEQQTLFSIFNFASVAHWFTQPASFTQNRPAVPLFVLYHSWKSFMS